MTSSLSKAHVQKTPPCIFYAEVNPLTLSLQSRSEETGTSQRATDLAIRNPLSDARENPLTLSPQSRGEGTEQEMGLNLDGFSMKPTVCPLERYRSDDDRSPT